MRSEVHTLVGAGSGGDSGGGMDAVARWRRGEDDAFLTDMISTQIYNIAYISKMEIYICVYHIYIMYHICYSVSYNVES